jgi:HAD superfamily hydrolase (TIGR01493 family)
MANPMQDIGACVFDAYGTLFDVTAAAAQCRDDLGDNADALAQIWRTRQLEYTWLRSLMGEYVEFWQVTGDGLDYALAALGIDDPALREKLMEIYMRLDAYPEVAEAWTPLSQSIASASTSRIPASIRWRLMGSALKKSRFVSCRPMPGTQRRRPISASAWSG